MQVPDRCHLMCWSLQTSSRHFVSVRSLLRRRHSLHFTNYNENAQTQIRNVFRTRPQVHLNL